MNWVGKIQQTIEYIFVVDLGQRPVNGNLLKVRTSQTGNLGIQIGEQPPLEHGIVSKINTRNHIGGAEGHLLCFSEKVEIRVLAGKLLGFIPYERMNTQERLPVKFYILESCALPAAKR